MSGGVLGAVLAAGAGRRMGGPKAELMIDGTRLVDRAAATLAAAGCDRVLAVVQAGVDAPPGADRVINPDPARGLRSSLALAVDAAGDCAVLVVLLADLPGVAGVAVRAVVDAWRPGRASVGRYADGEGHPVAMSPARWRTALSLAGPDEGARAWLRTHPELVDVVDVPGSARDLDTSEDLAAWLAD